MPMLLTGLLALLPAWQEAAAPPVPATPEEFNAAVGTRRSTLFTLEGLECWCENPADAELLQEPVRRAWEEMALLLESPRLPEGLVVRIVVLHGREHLGPYSEIIFAETRRNGAEFSPEGYLNNVIIAGAGLWAFPPFLLINGRLLRKEQLTSRVIHDLAALRARYASAPWGFATPEFFSEGFAGMLMRHTLKRPATLLSHDIELQVRAAGYGVFQNLVTHDSEVSNNPANWPAIVRNAVRAMRRNRQVQPMERLDALLLRGPEDFALADYAYSWAAVEFLCDDREPYGAAAVEARTRKKRPSKETVEANRRSVLLEVLAELLHPDFTGLDPAERSKKLVEGLLEGYGETPEELHAAFMHWVETRMPKK